MKIQNCGEKLKHVKGCDKMAAILIDFMSPKMEGGVLWIEVRLLLYACLCF